MVVDDLGDRLHIGYLGHDGFKAEQLGYWQVDRGVFELVAQRSEVTDILEERTEYPRQLAGSPPGTGPQPAISRDSTGYAQPFGRPSGQDSVPAGYGTTASGQHTTPAGQSPSTSGPHTTPPARAPARAARTLPRPPRGDPAHWPMTPSLPAT